MTINQIAFFDELEKIALSLAAAKPVTKALGPVGLGLDVGLAGVEGGVGAYKALKHGKVGLNTKLPYNPSIAAPWAINKAVHSGASRWAQDPNALKRTVGRVGLAGSKFQDAMFQMDPINALGGMAHKWIAKKRALAPKV
jgi:hypothetical protein